MGVLAVTGRINEIINRGGSKVSPDAIEEEIRKHPVVADAAAVGMLDSIGIEPNLGGGGGRANGEVDIEKNVSNSAARALPLFVAGSDFSRLPRFRAINSEKCSRVALAELLKGARKSDLAVAVR